MSGRCAVDARSIQRRRWLTTWLIVVVRSSDTQSKASSWPRREWKLITNHLSPAVPLSPAPREEHLFDRAEASHDLACGRVLWLAAYQ